MSLSIGIVWFGLRMVWPGIWEWKMIHSQRPKAQQVITCIPLFTLFSFRSIAFGFRPNTDVIYQPYYVKITWKYVYGSEGLICKSLDGSVIFKFGLKEVKQEVAYCTKLIFHNFLNLHIGIYWLQYTIIYCILYHRIICCPLGHIWALIYN